MSTNVKISEEIYKKFQAALVLTGENEETVLTRIISEYAHSVFESAMGNKRTMQSQNIVTNITEYEQKQKFVSWFRGLTRNGKVYNPVTISGYTGRIENACNDPVFSSVEVKNLFAISNLAEFMDIQKKIKACAGYAEFDAKSHNGFTAALRKYEEFLRFQSSGGTVNASLIAPYSYLRQTNSHRWTIEEDTICCKRFIESYVIKQSDIDMVQFLQTLKKEVPDVSEGSLRMKIQNIKYLTMKAGLKDTSTIKWLSQYSLQCENAFKQVLKEMNLE